MLSIRRTVASASRWLIPKNASSTSTMLAHSDSSTAVTAGDSSPTGPILSKNHRGYTRDGGLSYVGFTFYPRNTEHKEPQHEPSKALMVERIRCLKKKPYWQKNVMKEIGLEGKRSEIAVLPNTSSTCALLWKVKDLIRVTPISLPQGMPEDGDLTGARLLENGQLTFIPKIGAPGTNNIQLKLADLKPDHMDGETLRKQLRLKWLKPHH